MVGNADARTEMHVLNLTNMETPFFRQQVDSLFERGVTSETVMVPGRHEPEEPRGLLEYLRFVPRVLGAVDGRFDLVHANYGLTAPMALAQRELPVVLSLWGTDLYGPYGWVSRAAVPFCDEVIVMSERMRADLGREATVIPHGVDLERFHPMGKRVARERVGWAADRHYVLFPYAPERPEKDYRRARRIVESAEASLEKPVSLEVVTGVPQERFVTFLNAADALLLTSKYEGSPNVIKEALACNLPIVSTDVGDVRERLLGIEPSTVAETDPELTDALVDILSTGGRSNGRRGVADISLERTSAALLRVYERALEQ